MHCAGCVTAIQGYVSDLLGVSKVEVNLANEKAALEYDQSKVKLDSIEKAIEEVGYKVIYEKLVLKIGGISDSSDAQRLEQNLLHLEGIKALSANYGNSQMNVEYVYFFKALSTWSLNRVIPILLAYGRPFANDLAASLTNSNSTFGGIGGSIGSTYASIIVGFLSFMAIYD